MRIMDRIDRVAATAGMVCLFAIMIIVAVDGLGREFFDRPIVGGHVLVEKYLMVAMIFPMIGYTWAKKGHIGVTVFYNMMPRAVQNIAHLITILFGLAIFGLIGYAGYETTVRAIVGGQLTSGLIRWPLWLAYIWLPVGSGIFCLRLMLELIGGLIQMGRNGLNEKLE